MAKNSIFNRSKKLLAMSSKLAAKEVGLKISNTIRNNKDSEIAKKLIRVQQAQTITKNLAQLKGAAMKAGQLLSLDSSDFIPEEARAILSQLQNMAEPENFEKIQTTLTIELGDKLSLIQNLSKQATASASIGQVHKALYNEQTIVLKVQYPGIKDSIDSDLKILKNLVQLLLLPTNKSIDLSETFNELGKVLHLETDYINEAKMLNLAHQKLKDQDFFYAPKVFPEISTDKVLAMEFCQGLSLNDWLLKETKQENKDKIAHKMLDLFMLEFLEWNFVQTDPNFSNFLVQEEPLKLILLDFGSTLIYSHEFIKDYLDTLYLTTTGDSDKIFNHAVDFKLLDPRESEEVKKLYYELMMVSAEPFLSNKQAFNFSSIDYEKRSKKTVLNFTKSLRYSPPPRQVLFLHRKLGGIFNLLKRLDSKVDLKPYWEQMMKARDKYHQNSNSN